MNPCPQEAAVPTSTDIGAVSSEKVVVENRSEPVTFLVSKSYGTVNTRTVSVTLTRFSPRLTISENENRDASYA